MPPWSRTAPARPRTPPSPTSRWQPRRRRSRPARCRGRIELRSTTQLLRIEGELGAKSGVCGRARAVGSNARNEARRGRCRCRRVGAGPAGRGKISDYLYGSIGYKPEFMLSFHPHEDSRPSPRHGVGFAPVPPLALRPWPARSHPFLQSAVAAQAAQPTNHEQAERNRQLVAEVSDLKVGNTALEERARSELGMVGNSETFYQVVTSATPMPGAPTNSDHRPRLRNDRLHS